MMSIEQVVPAFGDHTLPKADWTHEAHLQVGLWHLLRYPDAEALRLLRDGIRRYNESLGNANTETSGYHETLTRFYLWRISKYLETVDRDRPIDELADELILLHGDRALPLRYWSRERLFSVEARLGWLEPDLGPLS